MSELLTASIWGLWFGILTSISPCPLATNIAAISFIGKPLAHPKYIFLTGMLYTLGRTLTYTIPGILLVTSILSAPVVSEFLQVYMNKILGPVLIITGMFLLELLSVNFGGAGVSEKVHKQAGKWGVWGGLILGVVFAMSFCPVSAALFFGSLIPLAVKYESYFLLPILYGVGTALPVFAFAIFIAFGADFIGKAFNLLSKFEVWARNLTGIVFILVGLYLSVIYIFNA